jgi:hypothetical protein
MGLRNYWACCPILKSAVSKRCYALNFQRSRPPVEFADLARGWHSLAAKIVSDQALLDLLKEIELSGDEPLEQAPTTEAFAA